MKKLVVTIAVFAFGLQEPAFTQIMGSGLTAQQESVVRTLELGFTKKAQMLALQAQLDERNHNYKAALEGYISAIKYLEDLNYKNWYTSFLLGSAQIDASRIIAMNAADEKTSQNPKGPSGIDFSGIGFLTASIYLGEAEKNLTYSLKNFPLSTSNADINRQNYRILAQIRYGLSRAQLSGGDFDNAKRNLQSVSNEKGIGQQAKKILNFLQTHQVQIGETVSMASKLSSLFYPKSRGTALVGALNVLVLPSLRFIGEASK